MHANLELAQEVKEKPIICTFQSGLPKIFSKAGVILELMSSLGRPSDEAADVDDAVSKALTVLFGGAAAPC